MPTMRGSGWGLYDICGFILFVAVRAAMSLVVVGAMAMLLSTSVGAVIGVFIVGVVAMLQ